MKTIKCNFNKCNKTPVYFYKYYLDNELIVFCESCRNYPVIDYSISFDEENYGLIEISEDEYLKEMKVAILI